MDRESGGVSLAAPPLERKMDRERGKRVWGLSGCTLTQKGDGVSLTELATPT
jgi:hypothetical protein